MKDFLTKVFFPGKRNSIFPTTQLSSPKVPSLTRAEVSLGAEEQVDGQPSIKSEMMQDPSMAELDESNGDTGSAIHSTDEGDDKDHLEPGLASNPFFLRLLFLCKTNIHHHQSGRALYTFPFLPVTSLSCP